MKKILVVLLSTMFIMMFSGFTFNDRVRIQNDAHEIAEIARSLGLSEDDPIIKRASELWWEAENTPVEPEVTYSEQDLKILTNVIYYEARGCSDRHQQLVAQVILNRVKDSRFPNSVKAVVEQPGQYAAWYTTANPPVTEQHIANAKAALEGKVNCPSNVIYQANFKQGTGVYEVSYVDTGWFKSTTYFCYG